MLSFEMLLVFVPVTILFVMMPGPDFAIVSKISLLEGRVQGQAAAVGVGLGILLHTMLAALGISAILMQSATVFKILKYAGSAYLLYLGVKSLSQSFGRMPEPAFQEEAGCGRKRGALWKPFQAGFLTNALNPKAILFFMVLFPQFMDAGRPIFAQFLELGLITVCICVFWFALLAWIFGRIRHFFASSRFQKWLLRATGGVLLVFGARLALWDAE